ncbi:MAG TPA: VacJ family lipoprotein [Caulobacteraceae bacterium]|jgi:phospholipid-binding lipoprotein MlaA|nr:VacJ family lipoprotein [Caulobacteraceae bacterium]
MASRASKLGQVIAPVVLAAAIALGAGAGAAMAQGADGPAARANDPFEPLNRGLYAVHRGIDKLVLRPVALAYLAVAPEPLRDGLHNALLNLGEPATVVNDLLQARIGKAATATGRFVTNSTIGVLGLFDVASGGGLPYHYADFGQTLGRYGVPAGPYVFVPVFGPSTIRDLGGRVVDTAADPVRQVRFQGDGDVYVGRAVLGAVDIRAIFDKDLQELDRSATDPYVTVRSAYLQFRQSLVTGGQVDVQSLPSFDSEPAVAPTTAAQAPPADAPSGAAEAAVRSAQ